MTPPRLKLDGDAFREGVVSEWLARRRYSFIDLAWIAAAWLALDHGHPILFALVVVVAIVVRSALP